MAIQHIDMGVPVGQVARNETLETEVAQEAAELATLEHRWCELSARVAQGNWRARRRADNRRHFDAEAKNMIKKFASSVTTEVQSRDDRAALRTRLYTDLLQVVQAVHGEALDRQDRSIRRLQISVGVAVGLLLVMAGTIAGLVLLN